MCYTPSMKYPPKNCEFCSKEFYKDKDLSIQSWTTRRFCSRECNDAGRRTAPKTDIIKFCLFCGKKYKKRYEMTWLKWSKSKFCSKECADKGKIRRAPSTAFKKGMIPHNFKEKGYGYQAVHKWIMRHYQKINKCAECGIEAKTQWANISGAYLRNREDFRELCYSCHSKEDRANPKHPKLTQA